MDRSDSLVHKGDRVVIRTLEGEVLAKEIKSATKTRLVLKSLNPDFEDRTLSRRDIDWMGRIVWVRQ